MNRSTLKAILLLACVSPLLATTFTAHGQTLYVAGINGTLINQVDTQGTVSQFAAMPVDINQSDGLAVDSSGNVFALSRQGAPLTMLKFDSNGVRQPTSTSIFSTLQSIFHSPGSIVPLTIGSDGTMYAGGIDVAFDNLVERINSIGQATTAAATSGLSNAAFTALTVDTSGNIFTIDLTGAITEITSAHVISPFAALPDTNNSGRGLIFDSSGNLYATDNDVSDGLARIFKITPDRTESLFATLPTGEGIPGGIVVDESGNFFVQRAGQEIDKVSPDGTTANTFATNDGGVDFLAISPAPAPAPEPASLALLTLGGIALLTRRGKA